MAGLITEPPQVTRSDARSSKRVLIVASHRGPVAYSNDPERRVVERNGGGLVTALRGMTRHVDRMRWICAAATAGDRAVAAQTRWTDVTNGDFTYDLRMLDLDRPTHHAFYGVIANPLLWFVQHELFGETAPPVGPHERRAWMRGYVPVNGAFAAALSDPADVPFGSIVMVHDYHLYLVPEMLRARRPDLFVHFFTHIPWPTPAAWAVLPRAMRDAIFYGLLGSDIVGFQTERNTYNFLLGCRQLLGLPVDFEHSSVRVRDREIAVRHYPISVDTTLLRNHARRPEVEAHRRLLRAAHPGRLVARVDRADPSKNIVRGFEAYARMLQRHPELHGAVSFLAFLQPSRNEISAYADYKRAIRTTVEVINNTFGRPGWTPIDLRIGEDLALALAAFAEFDVLMVNPVADGMNLVAKEALIVNETDGVLALSRRAGAHDELGAVALSLDPFDVDQQALALYDGLRMPRDARRARREFGADIVTANDLEKWLQHQLADIELMQAGSGVRT